MVNDVSKEKIIHKFQKLQERNFMTVATVAHVFGSVGTGAVTTFNFVNGLYDLEGSLVVTPGYAVSVYTSTAANTAGFLGAIQWEEIPI